MNILHMIAADKFSGPGAASVSMARGLLVCGHSVSFLCYPDCRLQSMAERFGCALVARPNLRSQWSYGTAMLFPAGLQSFVRAHGIEVVHCHRSRDQILAWRTFGRIPGGPALVRTWHSGSAGRPGGMARRLLVADDAVTVASAGVEAELCASTPDLKGRIDVVHGGVDIDLFTAPVNPAAFRREWGADEGTLVVGMIARLKAGRGHDLLLDAAASWPADRPVRVVLLGDGELRRPLEERIRELGLASRVRILAPKADFLHALAALDVAVQLEPGSDGGCRAVLECLTMGKPVIAPSRGAFQEIVRDGETGLLIPAVDAEHIRDAVVRVATSPDLRQKMSRLAREDAVSRFGLRHLGERLEGVYTKAVDRRRTR